MRGELHCLKYKRLPSRSNKSSVPTWFVWEQRSTRIWNQLLKTKNGHRHSRWLFKLSSAPFYQERIQVHLLQIVSNLHQCVLRVIGSLQPHSWRRKPQQNEIQRSNRELSSLSQLSWWSDSGSEWNKCGKLFWEHVSERYSPFFKI